MPASKKRPTAPLRPRTPAKPKRGEKRPKLLSVVVQATWAVEVDGEIVAHLPGAQFQITPAEWKKGWDHKRAFATMLKTFANADYDPAVIQQQAADAGALR